MSTKLPFALCALLMLVVLWLLTSFVVVPGRAAAGGPDSVAERKVELWRATQAAAHGLPLMDVRADPATTSMTRAAVDRALHQARVVPAGDAIIQSQPEPDAAAPNAEQGSKMPFEYWTGIAFHSYRDGNAEIYTGRLDGGDTRRVTNNPAADVNPRMRCDLGAIVFSSNRDGNWEIYSVAPDGSNLRRLTDSPGSDSEAVWSPDGTQIAFSSNRSGTWGIYVMAADGSNPHQLTGGADDGSPTWSPDGRKLAFLRYERQRGTLWWMWAAGTPVYSTGRSVNYAGHAAWSPYRWYDYITLDGDFDGDYWNEIDLGGYTGTGSEVFDLPGFGADLLMGSWNPDGSQVIFTVATYELAGRQLLLTGGFLATMSKDGKNPALLPGSSGLDFSPDWFNEDLQPPLSAARAPEFAPFNSIPVEWPGVDPGASGVQMYQVQARLPGEEWETDSDDWTTSTSRDWSGTPGDTIEFRSQAADYASNVEPWPKEADSTTRLYSQFIRGHLHDVRHHPVVGAKVATVPANMATFPSEPDGGYRTYLETRGKPVSFSASAPGYVATASTRRDARMDQWADFVLPPTENYLTGGGFDEQQIDPAWQLAGDPLPTRASVANQYGEGAIELGPASRLTEPELVAPSNVIALAAGGATLFRAWAHNVVSPGEQHDELRVSRKVSDSAWSPVSTVYSGPAQISGIRAALSSTGGLHVVWTSTSYRDGSKQVLHCLVPPERLPCNPAPVPGWPPDSSPDIAIDVLDGLHVAGKSYAHLSKNGVWDVVESIPNLGDMRALDVAGGFDGSPHLVWSRYRPDFDFTEIVYSTRTSDGSWSQPAFVSMYTRTPGNPSIAAGIDGTLFLTWADDFGGTTYSRSKKQGEDWGRPEVVSRSPQRVLLAAGPRGPKVLMVEQGQLSEYTLSDGTRWELGQTWPLNGKTLMQGVVDGQNQLHLLLSDPAGVVPWNIYYRGSAYSSATGASVLSQAVMIPAQSHRPTLSLMLRDDARAPVDVLRISVEAEGSVKQVQYTRAPGQGWQQVWADMSPWAGMTVRVQLEARQEVGRPTGRVWLDEITLGPWLTPVIEAVSAGQDGLLTVTGSNFIGTPEVRLDDLTLTLHEAGEGDLLAALPHPAPLGRHRVWVINPGGQQAARDLWIGRTAFFPQMVRVQ